MVYRKPKDKALEKQVFVFRGRPTLAELQETVEGAYPELRRADFSLHAGATVVKDEATWQLLNLLSRRSQPATVAVSQGSTRVFACLGKTAQI